jgi:hypothetical protein
MIQSPEKFLTSDLWVAGEARVGIFGTAKYAKRESGD